MAVLSVAVAPEVLLAAAPELDEVVSLALPVPRPEELAFVVLMVELSRVLVSAVMAVLELLLEEPVSVL